jgi:hypothetical protein
MASSATLALNSAVNRLRVLMVDRPLRHQIHLSRLSQKPGPPLSPHKIPAACERPNLKCRCISGPHFLIEVGLVEEIKPEHINPHAFFGLGSQVKGD